MKKIRNQITWIKLFCAILFLVIVLMLATSPKDKIQTNLIQNDVQPLLLLEDFDLNDKESTASLYSLIYNGEKIGKAYKSQTSNTLNSLKFDVYQIDDSRNRDIIFEQVLSEQYTDLQKYENKCGESCILPKIPYDKAIKGMIELNKKLWNIDEGYGIIFGQYFNHIQFLALKKENKIIFIELDSDLSLTTPLIINIREKLENIDLNNIKNSLTTIFYCFFNF